MVFAGVLSPNPFITCLLPRTLTNPLLMHSILTVSGSHLAYRLAEEAQGSNSPSKDLNIAKEALVKRIKAWAMDPLPDVASSRDTASLGACIFDWEQKRKAAECLRQALYIYAALSLLGCRLLVTVPKRRFSKGLTAQSAWRHTCGTSHAQQIFYRRLSLQPLAWRI